MRTDFKVGAWYSNPLLSEHVARYNQYHIKYWRIGKLTKENGYYSFEFDMQMDQFGKTSVCKQTQANDDFEKQMIEVPNPIQLTYEIY